MRLSVNTRCMLYTVAVLILCAIAQATFAAEPAPVVNVNTATAQQLAYLPGIGPEIAARIVAYRESTGPFASVDDLAKVKGIKGAKLGRIRPYVATAVVAQTTAKGKISVPKPTTDSDPRR